MQTFNYQKHPDSQELFPLPLLHFHHQHHGNGGGNKKKTDEKIKKMKCIMYNVSSLYIRYHTPSDSDILDQLLQQQRYNRRERPPVDGNF